MGMKILFLDVDGVLNGHEKHPNGFSGIDPKKMYILNRILRSTQAGVIVHSAWRYLTIGDIPPMTNLGFYYMFQTYGFEGHIIDLLKEDNEQEDRVLLIEDYIEKYLQPDDHYVIVDDLSLRFKKQEVFVQTDPHVGLTEDIANKIIGLLNEQDKYHNPRSPIAQVRKTS